MIDKNILNESYYELRNVKEQRAKTRHILIVPIHHFNELNRPVKPIMCMGSSNYTWGYWQRYFYEDLIKWKIPFHFFVEQVGNDFAINVADPEYSESYYLRELYG